MSKQIPYLFNSIVISSPFEPLIESEKGSISRQKVGVFTKYGNRNGSYITEEFAQHLIESAVSQHCPVVGFFDPETEKWAGHTGPTLACGYGYVEDFIGWEPLQDTDGVVRDYAVFSVVLHTNYFEEAKTITGANQSMELNPETIDGSWAEIDGEEYYVYTKGEMLGFCVIGENEPCFSASHFFSKSETNFEKLSALLFELREKVEGGETTMEENKNFEEVVEETVEETNADFEELQHNYEELQNSYNELQNSFNALQEQFNQMSEEFACAKKKKSQCEADLEELQGKFNEAVERIKNYEIAEAAAEEQRKDTLISSYEALLDAEEINSVKEKKSEFSYNELEANLAVTFSRKQLEKEKQEKIPQVFEEESDFARLMKKYKK